MIDVYAHASKVDGTSKDKLDAADEYIRSEWPNDSTKGLALMDAMESTLTYSMSLENEVSPQSRSFYGKAGQQAIYEQMTDGQRRNYDEYVKDYGITPLQFELALQYKAKHKKSEVEEYLRIVGFSGSQANAILDGLYKQK
jgi:hypothetical protein